ncbi:MAG TPA: Nif3-like dinuclear metal center hexameric protein [Bacteroidota bacterium]|nr:Nif3-like dinuclear metal center hexameric protein [Bacteroidota bacterium]
MVLRDIDRLLEEWAPKALAWEGDNVGIQIGNPSGKIRTILLALDLTDEVVREAVRRRADLVMTHHPLLFRPPRALRTDDRTGRLALALARNNIALHALHTNLDFAPGGVSHALAKELGLDRIATLQPLTGQFQKIVVFVPLSHSDAVMEAMAGEGAGRIGNYDRCSFRTAGSGTFRPLSGARPYTGSAGVLEQVGEERIEMIVPRWKSGRVIEAMRRVHPYEEVAFDLFDLATEVTGYGAGAVGSLPRAMTLRGFLAHVRRRLGTPHLRYAGRPERPVRTVAVCGGSGGEYLPAALRAGADAFVTADLRYHTFQGCDGALALIDAGHYETEVVVLRHLRAYLKSRPEIRTGGVKVFVTAQNTNSVHYS